MDDKSLYLDTLKERNYDMYLYFKRGLEIISILREKTHEAYIVGGAVRDFVLNVDFNDIDIATSATPSVIKEIFVECNIDDTYEHLGSIVIKENGFRYEITTFRNEEYVKYKLKEVFYSQKLADDLIRRDYTINALALTPNLTVVDLVGGQKDLKNGVIRIIGQAKKRFEDDPTRILRGLHLVAKYGFTIDSSTAKGMKKCRYHLSKMSELKINSLMRKILSEKYGLKALKVIAEYDLFKEIPSYSAWVDILVKKYKKLSFKEKMTLLYLIMGKIPENTGQTHEELKEIESLLELSNYLIDNQVTPMLVFNVELKDLLSADKVIQAYLCYYRKQKYKLQKRLIKKLERHLPIHSQKELDITTRELIELVNNDEEQISKITYELVKEVVNGEITNNNLELRKEAMRILNTARPSTNKVVPQINPEEQGIDEIASQIDQVDNNYSEYIDDAMNELIEEQISTNTYQNSSLKTTDQSEEELRVLKEDYREDFMNLYQIYLKGIKDYYSLSEREQRVRSEEVKLKVKEFLLRNNEKYRILHEKGMI